MDARLDCANQVDGNTVGPKLAQGLVKSADAVAFGRWFVAAEQGEGAVAGSILDSRGD